MRRLDAVRLCVVVVALGLNACSSPTTPGVSGADAGIDPSQTGDGGSNNMLGDGGTGGSSGTSGGSSGTAMSTGGMSTGGTSVGGGSSGAGASSSSGGTMASSVGGGSSGMGGASSSSGGTSSSVMGQPCMGSRDCDLGTICVGGFCTAGCETENDCANGDVCDTSILPNGACVECLTANDCGGQNPLCDNGTCRESCNGAMQCPSPLTCDTTINACVRCLDDNGCRNGSICVNRDCVAGCRLDADCAPGDVCEADQCVAGCRANPNTCRPGFICQEAQGNAGVCVNGCNVPEDCGDPTQFACTNGTCVRNCQADGDCPLGTICEAGACARGCRAPDRGCPNGSYCDALASGAAGQCLAGCDGNEDCFGGIARTCDTAAHSCVECLVSQDCELPGPGSNVVVACTPENLCQITCDPSAQFSVCQALGWTCSDQSNTCVECVEDQDCGAFETCLNSRCAGQPNRPLCAECDTDDDCGGPADLCVTRQLVVGQERVCGVDCSTGQACPAGTTCQTVGGGNGIPPRGQQCLPFNSVHRFTTCAARNDVIAGVECTTGGQCGTAGGFGGQGDAICSGFGASDGQCSVFCAVNGNDCPEGFFCEDPPGDPAPRCGPL